MHYSDKALINAIQYGAFIEVKTQGMVRLKTASEETDFPGLLSRWPAPYPLVIIVSRYACQVA